MHKLNNFIVINIKRHHSKTHVSFIVDILHNIIISILRIRWVIYLHVFCLR